MLQIEKEFDFFKKKNKKQEATEIKLLVSFSVLYLLFVSGAISFFGFNFIIQQILFIPKIIVNSYLTQIEFIISVFKYFSDTPIIINIVNSVASLSSHLIACF